MKDQTKSRTHPGYLAFILHRISGLCLALFLPVHLYVISLLLDDPQRFDAFLDWTSAPLVKFSESLLIVLAAAHLAGGIRILAIEWFAVPYNQARLVSAVVTFSIAVGVFFLIAA